MDNVEILADSLNIETGDRLTSVLVHRFPKCLLGELARHRVFSLSAGSSRAIPIVKVIENIQQDPYIPSWTRHKTGMGGVDDLSYLEKREATAEWLHLRDQAVLTAKRLSECGIAKQEANRALEAWMFAPVLITGSDWDNFFDLRCNEAAQPDFRSIALNIRDLHDNNKPRELRPGDWHISFIRQAEDLRKVSIDRDIQTLKDVLKVATARSARLSYTTHLGEYIPQKDFDLHDRLLIDRHLSPFEHSAKALPYPVRCRNFSGFMSYRAHIEDCVPLIEEWQ